MCCPHSARKSAVRCGIPKRCREFRNWSGGHRCISLVATLPHTLSRPGYCTGRRSLGSFESSFTARWDAGTAFSFASRVLPPWPSVRVQMSIIHMMISTWLMMRSRISGDRLLSVMVESLTLRSRSQLDRWWCTRTTSKTSWSQSYLESPLWLVTVATVWYHSFLFQSESSKASTYCNANSSNFARCYSRAFVLPSELLGNCLIPFYCTLTSVSSDAGKCHSHA